MLSIAVVGLDQAMHCSGDVDVGDLLGVGSGVVVLGDQVSVEEVGLAVFLLASGGDGLWQRLTVVVVARSKLVERLVPLALVTITLLGIVKSWFRTQIFKKESLLLCIDLLRFPLQLCQRHSVGTTMYSHYLLATIRQTTHVSIFQVFSISSLPSMLGHDLIERTSVLLHIITFTLQSLKFSQHNMFINFKVLSKCLLHISPGSSILKKGYCRRGLPTHKARKHLQHLGLREILQLSLSFEFC